MKQVKKTFLLISLLFILCANAQYLKNYDAINTFLETQNISKSKKYILQKDKQLNKSALRLFNGGEGIHHRINPNDSTDNTRGLFVEKHWKKMYKTYANDTLPKYWKKEDFPQYDLILENKDDLFNSSFYDKYLNTRTDTVLVFSEPMYYMNKKYIMFYFDTSRFFGSTKPQVVVMKKENDKWIVVRMIGDYWYY